MEKVIFGMGCFWCYQPMFQKIKGVLDTKVGYSGGTTVAPTYEQVSTGDTGHAEVIFIEFDPKQVSFKQLLEVFWSMHDPTTLNKQGADVGSQYRSVIFTNNQHQYNLATESLKQHQKFFKDKIVTEIQPFVDFYEASEYHQFFFDKNPNYGYCQIVINPKLKKFGEKFSD